ncbi:P-loop containing nucleoside triphosphate hydrolase protein [Ophiocordyceps camponoti-floridani]|uniref:P-loop containing nucleoside triphosphate hydrolase protein n=1 Tax=Ophiocordyceps camponoti-floridani TaxID=2030778 RepID=A0A8H4VEZ9_9HYPO|nr:P-loop containing nucleoside triphosphate hydrolase protein [Ophiocordyceps camponoti-floridani]
MEAQVNRLVDKTWSKYQALPQDQRLLIGIAGIPGSGKTTLSQTISQRLNHRAKPDEPAIAVPMDGFHLSRATLSALPNASQAHARRGAAFTFDAPKYLTLVRALRPPPTTTIHAPSFDHAVKDPKEDDIAIRPSHRVVVLEGNYLALDEVVWRDAAKLLDEIWFVEVGVDVARRRLTARHVRAGIARDVDEADRRVTENDLVNGAEIIARRLPVDEVILSREDDDWAHE